MCHMKLNFFAIVYHLIFFCLLSGIDQSCAFFKSSNCPLSFSTHPSRDQSVVQRPSQMAIPRRTGICTGSHENKSSLAEIRGLLKIHSNSSQAPLVADSSTSRGHSSLSYWLIRSALACFKWVTKSEARHEAGCVIRHRPFRVTKRSLRPCRGLGPVILHPKYFLFLVVVDCTSSSWSKNHPS